jgi:hypothetical protein
VPGNGVRLRCVHEAIDNKEKLVSDVKYRLVTRSDFDGLVCAVLLNASHYTQVMVSLNRRA